MISKIQILFPAVGNINDGGCAGTRSASVFLRKAGGCNFLVANPTNHLFTAFHSDVISYKPNACYGSFEHVQLSGGRIGFIFNGNLIGFAIERSWSVFIV